MRRRHEPGDPILIVVAVLLFDRELHAERVPDVVVRLESAGVEIRLPAERLGELLDLERGTARHVLLDLL
jgi:hypothetical protein